MKTLLTSAALMTAMAFAGCTTTGTNNNAGVAGNVGTAANMGVNIFKAAVDNQCRAELEKQNAWRIARAAMSVEQEAAMQDKICGCVSEQAPQHVTVVDMTNAAIDSTARAQLVTKVVAKSLQSCYTSLTKP